MSFFVVIRGPLGIGKSTVSQRLAQTIGAEYISIDRILDEPGVEEWNEAAGHYSERCFIRTNDLAVERTRSALDAGTPVIFDGNFYWKSQIVDLTRRLPLPHHVFTLRAPLELCVQRDSQRDPPHGKEATEQVYRKSTEFDWGVEIDATQPIDSVVSDIVSHLSRDEGHHRR